jgi:hypothetical protein
MTTVAAISEFDLLLDKAGSPYFTDAEKLVFLNKAQLEVLNRMVPDSVGGVVNFEFDENTQANVAPLIYKVTVTPSSGIVNKSTLNTTLQTASSDGGSTVFRVGAVNIVSNGKSVKFTRHNNINAFIDNIYKAPTLDEPRYTVTATNYTILPTSVGQVAFTVLKTPKVMTLANSPDWDDYVMNQVINVAVKLAAIPLRDGEILVDVRNSGIQSAQ